MSERSAAEYHPRWFRARVSTYWWLERRSYLAFILRELSSVFVAWSVVYLLLLARAVSQGDSRYEQFLAWSGRPVVLVINTVSLWCVPLLREHVRLLAVEGILPLRLTAF